MTDIVERLDRWSVSAWWATDELTSVFKDAAAEIRRLRSLAGAVSQGVGDYRTIAKDARHDLCGNE